MFGIVVKRGSQLGYRGLFYAQFFRKRFSQRGPIAFVDLDALDLRKVPGGDHVSASVNVHDDTLIDLFFRQLVEVLAHQPEIVFKFESESQTLVLMVSTRPTKTDPDTSCQALFKA